MSGPDDGGHGDANGYGGCVVPFGGLAVGRGAAKVAERGPR
jgi:hypothetical protein